jgi:endogenous inhibitor of DNA gyrase (YacG/DUF329 family)
MSIHHLSAPQYSGIFPHNSMPKRAIVPCPTCGKPNEFFGDPVGPFCSVRCQMVDLGKWMNEEYKISEPLRPDHLEEYEGLSGEELDRPDSDR